MLNSLIRKNSKAIGAAIGAAVALGVGSLLPDLVGTEDLSTFEAGLGAIIGAALVTWFAPKNTE